LLTLKFTTMKIKRLFLLIALLLAAGMFGTQQVHAQVILAQWNFPNNPDDNVCDGGIAANAAKTVGAYTNGTLNATTTYATAGVTTRSATNSAVWDAGGDYWQIDVVTTGYASITFSLSLLSPTNKSPKNFVLEYNTGSGWTAFGSAIALTKNVWGTSTDVALPAACNNQANVSIRARTTDDVGVNGTQDGSAACQIDDIAVKGVFSCTPPTTQASAFTSSAITNTSMTVGWTRGNGNNVMVVARMGSAPTDPASGTTYTANSVYGSGTACGGGYVVYNGNGTSVNVTGLSASTTYYYAIYEYSTTGPCYNLTELTGNATTIGGSPTIEIGTGTSTTTYPYHGLYHDARSQFIITAAELTTAGLTPGCVLTSLAFNVSSKASTQAYSTFTVKLASTAASSFSAAAWLTPAFTTVYTGNYTTAVGWNKHTFSSTFTWDGSSNILVETCFDNSSYTSSDPTYCSTTTGNTVCYADVDGGAGCTLAAEDISTSRPNMRFEYNVGTPCSGTPTGGNATASPNPTCPSAEVTLSVSGASIGSGLTYQWQSSPDNSTWTNIPGQTNGTCLVTPSVSTYYRRIITCTSSGLSANSASVNVIVNFSAACYCASAATSTGDEDITRVRFGTLNNSSACAALGCATGTADLYSNFYNCVAAASIQQGNTYTLTVDITECGGSAYSHQVNAYIDFNRNGLLTDPGEEFVIFPYASSNTHTITYNITIPIDAVVGATLLRVVCKESSTMGPCLVSGYGETEDYQLTITAAPACAGTPTAGTAASTITNFCNTGSPVLSLTGYSVASGLTFQWQSSPTGGAGTWSNLIGGTTTTFTPPSIAMTTFYRCQVTCTNSGAFAYSNTVTVTNDAQVITGTNSPVTVTCNSAATLTATASGGTINWYANATGGSALATGGTYSPTVTANTTYYCTASQGGSSYNVGQAAWTSGDGYTGIADWGIRFNVMSPITIVSVDVYVETAGSTVSVELQDATGIPIGSAVNYSTTVVGLNVIPLNLSVPIGNDYRLVSNNTTNLGRGSTGVAFPYTIPGVCTLTASEWGGTTTSTYYFLYNWRISTGCESSPRTPVNVIVSGGVTAPVCSSPAAPANGATAICPVAASVSWTASNTPCRAATSYKLSYGTNAAANNILSNVDVGNVLSYNLGTLTGNTTYYWKVVPTNTAGDATGCTIWSFTTAANPGSVCASSLGAGVVNVPSLPWSSGAGTTAGAVDDLTSANTVSCGSTSYLTGEDKVFIFTPAASGPITITLTSSGTYTGLILYDGCPLSAGACGAAPGTCVGYAQSSTGDKTLNVCVVSGVTYYLILDSYASPANNPYSNLTITSPSGFTIAANDMVCNAQTILLGDLTPGDNSCTSGVGEPPAPSCWTNGSINTVWYKFQAPASGTAKIKTIVGTLLNTQIAIYSGTCGTGMTMVACNDNAPTCGSSSYYNSELSASGLTPGAWYYIAVDGYDALTGSFSIVVVDGSTAWPLVPGQDCMAEVPVCAQTFTIGNPGYQAVGNNCDFGTNYCLLSGERGSAWYEIKVNGNGNLMFTIEPNDAVPAPGTAGTVTDDGTDYDFAVWKKTGSGAVTCAQILSGAATPLACNYSYIGITGLYTGGNTPANNAYTNHNYTSGAYDAAFEPPLAVTAGDTYWLVISNFSNSLSGFTISFTNSTNGFNFSVPNPLIWTGGGASTNWFDPLNWGNCSTIPTSSIDCIVAASSVYQPVIAAAGAVCKSITINAGASLTINSTLNLDVYGDYNNQGTLNTTNRSSVTIRGGAVQNMDGIMVTPSEFFHLYINKTAGSVITNQHIECEGDFITQNGTSIMNMNNDNLTVAKAFTNFNGNTTYIPGTGTLFFDGVGGQSYTNTNGTLTLNNVTMNNTGTGVTLNNDMTLGTSGVLTLNTGVIITGSYKVDVLNGAPAAVSSGNNTSFVQGNLQRRIQASGLGSYDFPVGEASKGYQRANFNFTNATTITNLYAYFTPYAVVPGPLGSTECGVSYDHAAIDNGYWTLTPTPIANKNSGNYTCTLYNQNYTNSAGSTAWTVMSDHGGGTWQLLNGDGTNGTCVASTVGTVIRSNMRGFSKFGTAASSGTPLPVDLLKFTGRALNEVNLLEWATASEVNNHYFSLEKSADGINFAEMAMIPGAGNSNSLKNYDAVDDQPYSPVTYYKLKQVDFDGKYNYSDIVAIARDHGAGDIVVNQYPNPATSEINIEIIAPSDCYAEIEIMDMFGRVIIRKNANLQKGTSVLVYDISPLAKGVYLTNLRFDNASTVCIKRFVKE
jgi:hypothetical protein